MTEENDTDLGSVSCDKGSHSKSSWMHSGDHITCQLFPREWKGTPRTRNALRNYNQALYIHLDTSTVPGIMNIFQKRGPSSGLAMMTARTING